MNNVYANVITKSTQNINTNEVSLKPVGNRVIFKLYPDNPYRAIEKSSEGLILGIDDQNKHFSNQSGEMEENNRIIVAAKIVAAGETCKWVHDGDDVFLCKAYATPIPFRSEKIYATDEINVICVISPTE